LAFTKQEKQNLVSTYEGWLKQSKAVYALSYTKMTMKEVDTLRAEARDAGAVVHVVKNTLMNIALKNISLPESGVFNGSSLVVFALEDAAAAAKVAKKAGNTDLYEVKGGYMDGALLTAKQIATIADLPPMPQMRAKLLGTLQAPASQLVRTLAEPARMVAAVLKAHSEKSPAPAAG